MDKDRIRIGEAAKILGVTAQTLRNWEKSRKLVSERSSGGQRFYRLEDVRRFAVDLQKLAWAWATSAQPPELPEEYYCERQDRFTSRLEKMGLLLARTATVEENLASLLTAVAGEIGDNSFM